MAATRYGRIYHSDHSYINLRFASADERKIFTEKFNAYHASHDHDGEVPRFENEVASKIGNPQAVTIHDAHSVSIDGYATYEIEEYHNMDSWTRRYRYKPPTCCVAPVISIDRAFLQSDILERHALSSIFGDMPEEDYASLLASVSEDGAIDNVIRLYEGQILDGWHRYRAAKELNLLRKLKFKQWNEKDEGDPKVFVYARNMERRHWDKATRAQVAVAFNKRFGHGGDRKSDESTHQNGVLKTKEELAKEAGVGTSTIDRAIVIEKEGESEAVISGKKTAGEVIKERDARTAKKRKKQVLKNLWDIRIQAARDYTAESDTDLNLHLTLPELEMGFIRNNEAYAEAFGSGMQRIDAARGFQDFVDRAFEVDASGLAKVDTSDLEEEYRAISTYAGDIRQWQREDWSPDTNWILPLIEAKKKKKLAKPEVSGDLQAGVDEMKTESAVETPEPSEDDLKTLREQVKAQMSKYKKWYKDTDYRESELVSHASFSQFIHVLREYRETAQDGAATVEELKDLLDLLKSKSYPFAHKLRQIVRPEQAESDTAEASESDTEKSEALEKFRRQKRDLYARIHETPLITVKDEFGNINTDKAVHRVMLAAYGAYGIPEDLLRSDQAVEALSADLIISLTGKYFLFAQDLVSEQRPDWVAELYQNVSDTESTEAFHHEPEPTSPTDAGCEIIDESGEDTSLTEIDNLPAVKHFLESLQKQVGVVEHQPTRDDYSICVFDALIVDSALTEREHLSILIDCALNLVCEYI